MRQQAIRVRPRPRVSRFRRLPLVLLLPLITLLAAGCAVVVFPADGWGGWLAVSPALQSAVPARPAAFATPTLMAEAPLPVRPPLGERLQLPPTPEPSPTPAPPTPVATAEPTHEPTPAPTSAPPVQSPPSPTPASVAAPEENTATASVAPTSPRGSDDAGPQAAAASPVPAPAEAEPVAEARPPDASVQGAPDASEVPPAADPPAAEAPAAGEPVAAGEEASDEDVAGADTSPEVSSQEAVAAQAEPEPTVEPEPRVYNWGIGWANVRGLGGNMLYNVDVAIGFVDGTVVPPGEIFSFDDVARTWDWHEDEAYAWGQATAWYGVIMMRGGGVCWVSTAIWRAAMDAGLHTTFRENHQGIVRLLGAGYDATNTLRFQNDSDVPIRVRVWRDDEVIQATIQAEARPDRWAQVRGPVLAADGGYVVYQDIEWPDGSVTTNSYYSGYAW